jgi:hypothetical protein
MGIITIHTGKVEDGKAGKGLGGAGDGMQTVHFGAVARPSEEFELLVCILKRCAFHIILSSSTPHSIEGCDREFDLF